MKKNYLNKLDYDKTFKDSNNNEWKYYSKKAIKNLYPKNGNKSFKIVGEIIKKRDDSDSFIENDNKKLSIGCVGYHKKILNRVSGYMQCGEDEFVLVMKKNWLLFFISLLSVCVLTLGIIHFSNSKNGPDLDANASDYVAKLEKPENFDPTKIAVPGYNEIRAKEGDTDAYVALWNPEYNPVYFKFDVVLNETGESLLKTKLIPPGKAVTKIPLNKNIKPGIYDITIKISSYSLEDYKTQMNGANVKTKLIILKN
ncbi:hypothetical protein [Clostridium baratii]|uniref:hypothetical protein n=1 Tax=Clostridium baratii TaxID=1561 RepID=UPI0030D114A7